VLVPVPRSRGAALRVGAWAAALPLAALPCTVAAVPIVDYQDHLNPRFEKRARSSTRYIIVHSTECRLESALRTLARGRARRGVYVTDGGHANYLVSRRGTIYRILDPRYRADHAGVSMWKGLRNLSDHSLGIELEGYHDVPFTAQQYRSLAWLLRVLRRRYRIESRDVLEHCRVAYTKPNRFFDRDWRGRKRDPGLDNFDRARAGLTHEYLQDPDVIAGRLGGERFLSRRPSASVTTAGEVRRPESRSLRAGVIRRGRSAWSIAGPKHDRASTLYVLPSGRARRGDEIADWSSLPAGTEVYLDASTTEARTLSAGRTAWQIAGGDYDSSTTVYRFPDGTMRRGDEIEDWSELPPGTRVQLGVPESPDRR
jgi:N-acetylmuramoyl-L-alanine amidase